ncbi:hypothetical protein DDE05_05395, partial [Streptomyces cavourensis]
EHHSDARPRSPRHLLRAAHVALEAAMRRVPGGDRPDGQDQDHARTHWAMTAGMLRVRVARWLYYLDPPPDVATEYLIRREAKELRSAAQTLTVLAADEVTAAQRLAARMAALIPTGPTTADTLRVTLARWHQQKTTVQDFLSLTPDDVHL